MSKYCYNLLDVACADAERISQILSQLLNEKGVFDPGRVTPMPAALHVTRYGYTQSIPGTLMSVCDEGGEWRILSESEVESIWQTGAGNCDDWLMTNWGTFGVADESEVDRSQMDRGLVTIRYRSVCFPPILILAKIREIYPDAVFTFSYRCCDDEGEDYPHVIGEGSKHEERLLCLARTWISDDA